MEDRERDTFTLKETSGQIGMRPQPVLVLALECGRPRAGSVRYRLNDLRSVALGRGPERRAELTGTELMIRVPDKWMSSRHARIEPSFGRWVLTDTESTNGSIVDGHNTKRAVLTDGSLIELGHTLFLFFERLPIDAEAAPLLELVPTDGPPGFATLMPNWNQELTRLRQIASSEIPMLIEGESGTGKEVIARAIHDRSSRRGAFVPVNCSAIPKNLVERELFGYKKGAFRGAQNDHPGLICSADTGTLFLDEIGELPSGSQAALLRVLQESEVMPVGGTRPVAIDLRVIAATTHRDLEDMVDEGSFRQDVFARLAGFRITVPPLAERRADLGVLIGVLHARIFGVEHPGFDIEAARLLLRYPWPLNVRELEQALTTAQVLAGADSVRAEHLSDSVRTGLLPGAPHPVVLSESDQKVRDQVVAALRVHQGNVTAVARALGEDRKRIQRWVKRFRLDISEFREGPPDNPPPTPPAATRRCADEGSIVEAQRDVTLPYPGRSKPRCAILFLAARPDSFDWSALEREARAIEEELKRSGYREGFKLEKRWGAEPLDLLRELRRLKPTVVHFSGQAGRSLPLKRRRFWPRSPSTAPDGDTIAEHAPRGNELPYGLLFHGRDGRAQFVSSAAINETFGAAGASVKVVVLNACYSEVQADALLAHVDCVVGMAGSIDDAAARNFAIGFYGAIGEAASIAAAYKQGRAAISLEGLRDSDIPRLRVRNGVDADQLIVVPRPAD